MVKLKGIHTINQSSLSLSQRIEKTVSIKAELENVTDLIPNDTTLFFRIKCSSCQELHPHPVSIDAEVGNFALP